MVLGRLHADEDSRDDCREQAADRQAVERGVQTHVPFEQRQRDRADGAP
jgi:hypothetical protein